MPGIRRTIPATAGLLLMAGLMLAAGCRSDGDSWERIRESGVLRIGIDPTFPPFALADGDALEGIDADLGRALAAELGLEPQFTYFGYDGLYDALATNQVDVLLSALVLVPERTKDVAYATPYFDAGLVLVVPAESDVAAMNDLSGRTLAVELGALGHVEALEWQKHLDDLTIVTYESTAGTIGAVAGGEADAALVDSVSGRLFLRDQPADDLTLLKEPVYSEPYSPAVRIEDRILLMEINEALARLADTGRLDEIINQHLGR